MAQANVYSSPVTNQVWFTDKVEIVTGATTVTMNVTLGPDFMESIYSTPPQIAANSRQQFFVGVGNQLTVTGGSATLREIGTASSGSAGVN